MTRFFLLLIRIFALMLSFMLSTLVAAVFFTFVLFLGADTTWVREDVEVAVASVAFVGFMWITIAQLTLVPAVIAFFVLEAGRMDSLLANLIAGGLCAFVAMVLAPVAGEPQSLPYLEREIWIAAIASGFVGGFTHWLLAGLRAGRWMGPRSADKDVSV